jgi:acid phosphatase type 7
LLSRNFPQIVRSVSVILLLLSVVFFWETFFPPHYGSRAKPAHTAELDEPAVLIGAGDISVCGLQGDDSTAALIDRLIAQYPQAQIFTAGDNAQLNGEMYEYSDCFDPSWGRFVGRIHPSPGNHDWYIEEGSAYFSYFGSAAGRFGLGYYSYNLGSWHIISLNSNCSATGCAVCNARGCGQDSIQLEWLKRDLAMHKQPCTLLYWHHPLHTSGIVPVSFNASGLWRVAVEAGAEIVVNGHDHHYERFAPLDQEGMVDPARGIRSFIVGTGGAWLFPLAEQPLPISEVRNNDTFGVILFKLYSGYYEWEFQPVDPGGFSDAGSGICHP